jgi:hypothetical protein
MSQEDFDIRKAVIVKYREERGCGLRKPGGLYLCGMGTARICDRGFLIINACPVCGERPRFTRGIAKIDFVELFGEHKPAFGECKDPITCATCYPSRDVNHYLMWVGRDYTMTSFVDEAISMGVSKRISKVPSDFVLGRDWVYLARKSVKAKDLGIKLDGRKRVVDGIFYAFSPSAIEYVISEEDLKDEKKIRDLVSRGITPVLEVDKPDRE